MKKQENRVTPLQHVVSGEVRRHSELIHELELVRQFVPGCIEAEETVAAVERSRKLRASRTAFFAMALGAWRAVTTVGAITPMTINSRGPRHNCRPGPSDKSGQYTQTRCCLHLVRIKPMSSLNEQEKWHTQRCSLSFSLPSKSKGPQNIFVSCMAMTYSKAPNNRSFC